MKGDEMGEKEKRTSDKILVTIREISAFLRISPPVFYRLLGEGFPARKLGRTWRTHSDRAEEWMKAYLESRS